MNKLKHRFEVIKAVALVTYKEWSRLMLYLLVSL